jgi:hypothetical protein
MVSSSHRSGEDVDIQQSVYFDFDIYRSAISSMSRFHFL